MERDSWRWQTHRHPGEQIRRLEHTLRQPREAEVQWPQQIPGPVSSPVGKTRRVASISGCARGGRCTGKGSSTGWPLGETIPASGVNSTASPPHHSKNFEVKRNGSKQKLQPKEDPPFFLTAALGGGHFPEKRARHRSVGRSKVGMVHRAFRLRAKLKPVTLFQGEGLL